MSEVFVGVARGMLRFRGDEDALRRWVFTIAHRRMVDSRRRAARPQEPVAELPEQPVNDAPPGLDLDLMEAMAELTPLQRARSSSSGSSPISPSAQWPGSFGAGSAR
ncbi:MAG: sigma-70 family RNA polymerase sigma factor [Acidimicrobiales bacterium]